MPRPAKKQVVSSDGGQSIPPQTQDPTDLSAKDVNKQTAPAPQEEEDVNTETAPAQGSEESSEHEQSSTDEEIQTQPGIDKQKQPFSSAEEIQKRIEVIRADLNLTSRILDTLPPGLNGPLAMIATQMKRMNNNIEGLSQEMINFCSLKNDISEVPPHPAAMPRR